MSEQKSNYQSNHISEEIVEIKNYLKKVDQRLGRMEIAIKGDPDMGVKGQEARSSRLEKRVAELESKTSEHGVKISNAGTIISTLTLLVLLLRIFEVI